MSAHAHLSIIPLGGGRTRINGRLYLVNSSFYDADRIDNFNVNWAFACVGSYTELESCSEKNDSSI